MTAPTCPYLFYDTAVYKKDESYLHYSGGETVDPAAIKKDALPHGGYAEMIATTTLLNRVGARHYGA